MIVYLDYNATALLDPAVREAMLPFFDQIWGNPSSVHSYGRRARAMLDEARERSAQILRCRPSEVVFTSGGTESVNLALFGTARLLRPKGRHLITSQVEHHAVLHSCKYLEQYDGFEVTYLPVDTEGRVSIQDVQEALRPDTILVSVMAANNEIGTLQPVAEIGALCRERGVLFHTDAVQWFGKEAFKSIDQFNADLVSICAHKFHGPKGAGALFIRSPLLPHSIHFGGGHENERRAGTENLAGVIGLVEAMERFVRLPVFQFEGLQEFGMKLAGAMMNVPGVQRVSPQSGVLPNTFSFVVEHADSIALLAALDMEGICASSGSACMAGSIEPSHVVRALGLGEKLANSLVRFSLGRENTAKEVDYVCRVAPEVIRRVQGCE